MVHCRTCLGVTFGQLTIPVEDLNAHLSMLAGRYTPAKVILVRNKDKPWFEEQFSDFYLKQEAHLRWTRNRSWVNLEQSVRCQIRANQTYSEAKGFFSVRTRGVLTNAQSPHKWWSTLMTVLFGVSS